MRCVKTSRLWIIHFFLNSHLPQWVLSVRDKPNCQAGLGRKRNHQFLKPSDFQGCGDLGGPQMQSAGETRGVLQGPLCSGHGILKTQLAPKPSPFVPKLLFPHFYTRFSLSFPPPPSHGTGRAPEPVFSQRPHCICKHIWCLLQGESTPKNCLKTEENYFRKKEQTN